MNRTPAPQNTANARRLSALILTPHARERTLANAVMASSRNASERLRSRFQSVPCRTRHRTAAIELARGAAPREPWDYRWWPRPIPSFNAFCRKDPSDFFMSFATFVTGVFAFECCLSNLMSAAVYGLRASLFFVVLAN